MTDTIYALATAPARSAVAVVRISGPRSGEVIDALAGSRPEPRRASLRRLRASDGSTIDEALVLWFEGPASFTGEDAAELHVHGGPAVIEAVSAELTALDVRPAEPGAFTRRAFEHGKLDLTQAEAVADLIDAQTSAQRRQAMAQLEGALGDRYRDWRSRLIEASALLEAEVDFPDEALPGRVGARSRPVLTSLRDEVRAALRSADRGERVREGYRIALLGAPNAGKSSLLNALLRRDAAIVSDLPGTTRDVIEATVQFEGYAVLLADMAGIRAAVEEVEAEGVRRARRWSQDAALRVLVVDQSETLAEDLDELGARAGDLLALSKTDRSAHGDAVAIRQWARARRLEVHEVSVRAPETVERLLRALGRRVRSDLTGADAPAVTQERHRLLLKEALRHLERALAASEPELAAEDVRLAARSLGQVVGTIGVEDVLGRVFASFCIGK